VDGILKSEVELDRVEFIEKRLMMLALEVRALEELEIKIEI
jgi:hypothetical protein